MAMYLGDKPVKVIARSKNNLLNIFGRTSATYDGNFDKSFKRNFDENKYYLGLSGNNYWNNVGVAKVSFIENGVIVTRIKAEGYGIAFPVKCQATTTYTVSTNVDNNNFHIWLGYYTKDGEFIRNTAFRKATHTFTTPENCEWLTVCLVSDSGTVIFQKIMLNEGSTALPYEPYNQLFTVPIKKCVGKNLLNAQGANYSSLKPTGGYTLGIGSIHNPMLSAGDANYIMYEKLYPVGKYVITANVTSSASGGTNKLFRILTSTKVTNYAAYNVYYKNYILADQGSGVGYKFTATQPFKIGFAFTGTRNSQKTFSEIMLNEGDPLPYEPYTEWYEY